MHYYDYYQGFNSEGTVSSNHSHQLLITISLIHDRDWLNPGFAFKYLKNNVNKLNS